MFHTTDLATTAVFTNTEKNKKKTNQGKTRGRQPSANKERQPRQISFMKKLDYTSRFVRVISTLSPKQSSHNSIGDGGRYNTVVTASTSQQFLKLELLIWFPGSALPDENIAASFPGAVGIRDDLQSSRLCTYSGEASILRNSPSSRSESAMLSAESYLGMHL